MPSSQSQISWKPKAILFDLLTALLDSWTLWNACAGNSEAGRSWRAKYLDITFSCGAYKPYFTLVRQAAVECGAFPSDEVAEECATALMSRWEELKAWGEVPGVLKKLRDKGYKLGVVTNCSRALGRRAAECVGADAGFDVVITAEDSG
jgi:2-haloacid dehalogenase